MNFIIDFLSLSKPSERSERGLGSEENCGCLLLIDSEMAGPIQLKLGGMVEGMGEIVLAKEIFVSKCVKVSIDYSLPCVKRL